MKLFLREGGVLFNLVFSRLLRTKLIFFFFFLYLLQDNQKISFNSCVFPCETHKTFEQWFGTLRLCTVILCGVLEKQDPQAPPQRGLTWSVSDEPKVEWCC